MELVNTATSKWMDGWMDAHELAMRRTVQTKRYKLQTGDDGWVEVRKGKVVNEGDCGGALSYSGGLVAVAWSPTPGRRRVARGRYVSQVH